MKTLNKIDVVSAANVLGVLGALGGLVKVVVLPLLAVLAAGNLGDVAGVADTLGTTASKNIPGVVTYGAVGWVGGAVWAYLLNHALKITKGLKYDEGK